MAQSEMDAEDEAPERDLDALPRNVRGAVEALRRLHVDRDEVDETHAYAALQHLLKDTEMEDRVEGVFSTWREAPDPDDGS